MRSKTLPLLISLALAALLPGQATAQTRSGTGVIILAHGGDSVWNAGVLQAAAAVKGMKGVEVAFLMGPAAATHRFQDQITKLNGKGVQDIVIVPLLVSSHSGHYEQIRWLAGETDSLDAVMEHHLHMGGLTRAKSTARLHVARALDSAGELTGILSSRAATLAKSPASQALFLIGHGPNSAEDYASWMKNLRVVAERVRVAGGFRDVKVDLVRDDAPPHVRAEAVLRIRELIRMQAQLTGADVVTVPILVSRGSVGDQRFREDLAGLPITYSGDPLLPHPLVARWIETRVGETLKQ